MTKKEARPAMITRREFLKMMGVSGGAAVIASCAPKTPAGPAVELPDLTSGASIPLDKLTAAAQSEGLLTTIALPHDWANYGEIISTYKTKFNVAVNELNPNAGSSDELEAIRANKDSKGPQAPDVIDIGVGHTATAMKDGLLAKYKVATWDTIEMKDPDGF